MFEKEAEEYCGNLDESKTRDFITDAFKDGAEFGYNKANEWHYVKDEFPPENVPLNIITLDKNKKRRLWEGEYKGGNGQWWTGYFNHFIDVPYAWKEIVLPKEIE
jgi:hypothetical protein